MSRLDSNLQVIVRPGLLLEPSPDGACAIGIQIGVDFISVMLADFMTKPFWHKRVEVSPTIGQTGLIENTGDLIRQALRRAKRTGSQMLGICVGVPGLVDLKLGGLDFAPNLKWRHVPLRQMLTKRFNVPVFVENDANASALGEYYFGVARGVKDFTSIPRTLFASADCDPDTSRIRCRARIRTTAL
ncbi:MAG: ROK family protein [Chloroflexota bacterium]